MKKVFLLAASAFLTSDILFAQPILTAANSAPSVGVSVHYAANSVFASGPSGPAQSWDFTPQWPASSQALNSIDYIDCNSTPSCSLHPGTTVVGHDASLGYYYYTGTPASLTLTGTRGFNNADLVMDDPEQMRSFPCTYGTSFTDSFYYHFYSNGGPSSTTYTRGRNSVVADGWGTLKTPAGTFNNTLRLHQTEYSQDSVVANGSFSLYTLELNIYSWYDTAHRDFLYQTQSLVTSQPGTSPGNISRYAQYSAAGVAPAEKALTGVTLWPNPAATTLKIQLGLSREANISVQLTDVLGRVVTGLPVTSRPAGASVLELPVGNVAPGLYNLQINAGGYSDYHKIVVAR